MIRPFEGVSAKAGHTEEALNSIRAGIASEGSQLGVLAEVNEYAMMRSGTAVSPSVELRSEIRFQPDVVSQIEFGKRGERRASEDPLNHSLRNASTGCTRSARNAGK